MKQEQHSPKKEKTHALLHYLLNKDDSKDPLGATDSKPKLEELEGGGGSGPGAGISSTNTTGMEGKVKVEQPDEVNKNKKNNKPLFLYL